MIFKFIVPFKDEVKTKLFVFVRNMFFPFSFLAFTFEYDHLFKNLHFTLFCMMLFLIFFFSKKDIFLYVYTHIHIHIHVHSYVKRKGIMYLCVRNYPFSYIRDCHHEKFIKLKEMTKFHILALYTHMHMQR